MFSENDSSKSAMDLNEERRDQSPDKSQLHGFEQEEGLLVDVKLEKGSQILTRNRENFWNNLESATSL